MKELIKYELDFNKTLSGFMDIADGGNILSKIIIDNINFQKGKFFTLLPENVNTKDLYKFKYGGILPQNKEIEYEINGEKATYSLIPNIIEEISFLIKDYLQKGYSCIMDNVESYLDDESIRKQFDFNQYIFSINKEIIYLINSKDISLKNIEEMLCKSRAIWHSLGVLIDKKVVFHSKKIDIEELRNICDEIKIIFINAYDGEGYVFWQRK